MTNSTSIGMTILVGAEGLLTSLHMLFIPTKLRVFVRAGFLTRIFVIGVPMMSFSTLIAFPSLAGQCHW